MGTETKIEWADSTWSPWRGCTKVSPGCLNCYAETLAKRNPAVMGGWGKGAPRVLAKNWHEPMRWQKRTAMDMPHPRVFPSLCDWLDDEVPVEWLVRFLQLIRDTPSLDWLLLTKRPQQWGQRLRAAHCATTGPDRIAMAEWLDGTPPVNVWMGVSVEDQKRANERIPRLFEVPSVRRWVSAEPLLGPVCFGWLETLRNFWVVVGGESGPNARPCHADWIRGIVQQCSRASVPVFVKQVGARPVDHSHNLHQWLPLTDRKGGTMAEWPGDIRVRQFPDC